MGKSYDNRTTGAYSTSALDYGCIVPNYDYAPNTNVESNQIYNNDIGVLAADQETRIVQNTFFVDGYTNAFADVFIGNKNLDYSPSVPNRYVRAMLGNVFDETKAAKYRCRVSTTVAKASGRINGSDASRCTTTFPYRL